MAVPAAPLETLADLVSVTTAFVVAVVTSVLDWVFVLSNTLVPVTVMVLVCVAVKRNATSPAGTETVDTPPAL